MADWTASERCEEIRELKNEQYRIAGFLQRKETSLCQVTLSLDCSESLAKRLSQQIRGMQKTVLFREFKDPEPANSEDTFPSILNRNHVSEGNQTCRHLANSAVIEVQMHVDEAP